MKSNAEWSRLVRPLKAIPPDETIESTLTRMQGEAASVYIVEDGTQPVGLITLEDILEQVVGQIEDEYPHEARISLADAVANGGIVLDLKATSREQCIHELIDAIPDHSLPRGVDKAQITNLTLSREEELSTDLGNGIAIPHARCPKLTVPLVVVGRSTDGVLFSTAATELVHLVFLLVTPAEQPEAQLALLAQLANVAGTDTSRNALIRAEFPGDVVEILLAHSRNKAGEN